jgi:hypothetical protein
MIFEALVTCVCEGACAAACGDNTCAGYAATYDCTACLQDTQYGCGNEFNDCANDF